MQHSGIHWYSIIFIQPQSKTQGRPRDKLTITPRINHDNYSLNRSVVRALADASTFVRVRIASRQPERTVGVRMWPNGGHIELLRQPVTDVRPGILIIHGSSIHSPRASPILQIPVALQWVIHLRLGLAVGSQRQPCVSLVATKDALAGGGWSLWCKRW